MEEVLLNCKNCYILTKISSDSKQKQKKQKKQKKKRIWK